MPGKQSEKRQAQQYKKEEANPAAADIIIQHRRNDNEI